MNGSTDVDSIVTVFIYWILWIIHISILLAGTLQKHLSARIYSPPSRRKIFTMFSLLFSLLSYSCPSGSLMSSSMIHAYDSMAIQVAVCLLVLWLPFHSFPFFSSCKLIAAYHWQNTGNDLATGSQINWKYTRSSSLHMLIRHAPCSMWESVTIKTKYFHKAGKIWKIYITLKCPVRY